MKIQGTPKKSNVWRGPPREDLFVEVVDGDVLIEFQIRATMSNEPCEMLLSMLVNHPDRVRLSIDKDWVVHLSSGDMLIGGIGMAPDGMALLGSMGIDIDSLIASKVDVTLSSTKSALPSKAISKLMSMADFVEDMTEREYAKLMSGLESTLQAQIYVIRIGLKGKKCLM